MNIKYSILAIFATSLFSCKDTDPIPEDKSEIEKAAVIENYANIVYANYSDALSDAEILQTAVNNFLANPSESSLLNAQKEWIDSRESYLQTEAFRFSNGPIDDEDGPEGLLNAWPLDENYVDYVDGDVASGLINSTTDFPVLDNKMLDSLNELGGDKNISVGYHAVEFLLWGQDLTAPSEKKAGLRSFTDYTTATNAVRRGQYLTLCAENIVTLLGKLKEEWAPGKISNYRTQLVGLNRDVALAGILQGIGIFAASELGGERVIAAYNAQDQEEEHSCFSDNTHRDVIQDIQGVKNVFLGTYTTHTGSVIKGKSIADLVRAKDEALYNSTIAALDKAYQSSLDIPAPFDHAITNTTDRPKVVLCYNELQNLGDSFKLSAKKLGFTIDILLPE